MSTRDQLAGYETEVAVRKALSGIGFPCWLEEQKSDPLVLRLSALRVSTSPLQPIRLLERPAPSIYGDPVPKAERHFSRSTKVSFPNALGRTRKIIVLQ